MVAGLSLLVRFLHLLGVVAVLGGAAFTWNALRVTGRPETLSRQYEWVFWGTLGVLLVTGVGNVGALGAPSPRTRWGTVLTVKLSVVGLFVAGSFLRTLLVLRGTARGPMTDALTERLRTAYALTTIVALLVVALAEVLAHG